MKDYATYETAVRLKEAGFPQPAPEAGQVWYLPIGVGRYGIFCCYGVDVSEKMPLYLFATSIKKDIFYIRQTAKWRYQMDSCFFAPTAMDILKVIGGDYGLFSTPHGFEIWRVAYGFREEFIVKNKNPAEAAAQAFLNLKAKP